METRRNELPQNGSIIYFALRSFPIAVVEAKEEGLPAVSGLEQVKGYARDLGLAFAYATNGHDILEWDSFTNHSRTVDRFPTPAELWQRWLLNTGLTPEATTTNELRQLQPVAKNPVTFKKQHYEKQFYA